MMPSVLPIRTRLLLACLLGSASLLQAQVLPATSITSAPLPSTPLQSAPTFSASPGTSAKPSQRAHVEFAGGKLLITAENSSLNQILREITRTTGLKITGGVADERVFGTYGPADTSTVLSALLDGSGSNIMFIQDSGNAPQELVLTPRHGGATPPNPNASRDTDKDENTDSPPSLNPHTVNPQPVQPQQTPAQPFVSPQVSNPQLAPHALDAPAPASAPPATVSPTPANPPDAAAPGTTTQESPNGVKTPQQIYDQLLKLQQSKPSTQSPPQ